MKSIITIIVSLIVFVYVVSAGHAAILDNDAITSGSIPGEVKLLTSIPETQWDLRAIREFTPCLKLHVREAGLWRLAFAPIQVASAKQYDYSISFAAAAIAGQSPTPDVAGFRPENQIKQEKDITGKGNGDIVILGIDPLGQTQILTRESFRPTNWTIVKMSFSVPDNITSIQACIDGDDAGVYFFSEMAVTDSGKEVKLSLPTKESLQGLQGQINRPYSSIITSDAQYSIYRKGQTVKWSIAKPFGDNFTKFKYKVINGYRQCLLRGFGHFPSNVEFSAPELGYYELVVEYGDDSDNSKRYCDYFGVGVLSPRSNMPAGSTPWGMGGDWLGYHIGATWGRCGLTNWTDDISDIDTHHDFSEKIKYYKDLCVMPQHASNNISGRTNSLTPSSSTNLDDYSGINSLPADLEQYKKDYAKLTGLGDGFVENFEFWNEPEGRIGYDKDWTFENFTKALIAAHEGMKSANPNAKMGIGSNIDVLASINKCGGKDAYEYLVLHPYPWAVGGPWKSPEDGILLETCISAREWLDSNGGEDKQIWSTEYGYTTGTTESGCSDLQQAQMNIRASILQLAGGLNYIGPFRMEDVWFWGQVDGRFGYVRDNPAANLKPAFVAYAVSSRTIRGLPYQGSLDAEKNLGAFVFGNDDETVVAFWATRSGKKLDMLLPVEAALVDMFGETQLLSSGCKTFIADESPRYISIPVGYQKLTSDQPLKFYPGLRGEIFDDPLEHKYWDIPMLTEAPKVDGLLEDWSGPYIEVSDPSQGVFSKIRVVISGKYLYLMGSITGQTAGENNRLPAQIWNGDCIEFYLSSQGDTLPIGFYRQCDYHLGISPGTDGCNGTIGNILVGHDPVVSSAIVKYKPNAEGKGGYDIEACIPLSYFNIHDPKPGDKYGFDIQVSFGNPDKTSDHGRKTQLTWSGTGQNYLSPYLWGRATLR